MPQNLRVHAFPLLLLALALLSAAHQSLLWQWLVEDAAISFSYARNLVNGYGLVHTPGAEPVEGYSNPTWVALLALLFVSGADLFDLARGLGLACGSAAVVAAGLLARRLAGPAQGEVAGLAAAALLAGSTHHATWSASGLENPLFVLLLLLGGLSVTGRRDLLGGLCFAMLGLTRPEGVMYGLLAGAWLLLRGPRRLLRWAPAFLLPLAAAELARLWYFAWPLPNTYYAKAGQETLLARLDPDSAGVQYLRRHLSEGTLPWLFPVALLGAVGRDSRLLLVAWVAAAAFFAVWSGGDWMKGARWLSFLVPLLTVLGGLGLARLVPSAGRVRLAALLFSLLGVASWTVSQVRTTSAYAEAPETSPMSVRARMTHARDIQADLLLEDPTWLDVDMGASTTWSRMAVVDYGRLLDVPMAHHRYRADVLEEHISTWHRVDLAHLHGRWANRTRLDRQAWWKRDMVEVSGYPLNRPEDKRHPGIWVRRSHLAPAGWQRVRRDLLAMPPMGQGLVLVETELWNDQIAVGQTFLLDLGLARLDEVEGPVVLEVELLDPQSVRVDGWRVEAGRAWYPARSWRVGETVRTRAVFRVGEAVPPGLYGLRVRVEGSEGQEVGTVRVVPVEQAAARLHGARQLLVEQAARGDCDGAQAGWEALRLMSPRDRRPTAESRRVLAEALGECLRGRIAADPESASADLATLVEWHPDHPQSRALVEAHADAWMAQAEAARRAGDAAAATVLYDRILRVDPTRTWARRRKEELRADGPVGRTSGGPS